ncbi:cation diffusion facilitator family transporter [Lutibaculum baratangense]|uniref:Cobalt-zinc-cadmium resistance protein CzcD n=1 Tax=Lutibaculum baratangense AMV1 TaxID=631454 RepID=V4RQX4_9HYPH|nr:cation diffusion facilitator family transporter [Lutibaculum baratangense]ESR25545.1 Cobalt-zinc-cadmium resistance protein CzcD [Lutibaculum baratangense AMV1]
MGEHHHHHGHDHSHGHHDHAAHASETRLAIAAALTGVFMLAEVVGGVLSGSLALIADAGHMLTDFAALSMSWFAFRLARRPADWQRTYGYDRFQILVAFANGLTLFFICGWIVYEAWQRFADPRPIEGGLMMAVAVAGLVVNIVAFCLLHGGDRDNLNMRGAALHVLGDLLGSVGALIAAGVIMATGWTPIDPILSVVIAAIVLRSAWRVVSESAHILLEASPKEVDSRRIGPALVAAIDAVEEVHHIHVWAITEKRRMVTLHACIRADGEAPEAIRAIKRELAESFGLEHATVEIEYGCCADRPASPQEAA